MKGHIRDVFIQVKKTPRQAGKALIIVLIAAFRRAYILRRHLPGCEFDYEGSGDGSNWKSLLDYTLNKLDFDSVNELHPPHASRYVKITFIALPEGAAANLKALTLKHNFEGEANMINRLITYPASGGAKENPDFIVRVRQGQPIMIGVHGDHAHDGDTIENIVFDNIDILEHHEP